MWKTANWGKSVHIIYKYHSAPFKLIKRKQMQDTYSHVPIRVEGVLLYTVSWPPNVCMVVGL